MRLIVIAPTTEEGKFSAEQCRRKILMSIGYGLSGYQIFIFAPETKTKMRGFSLKEGDHIFYVDGWDDDKDFAMEWHLCCRLPEDEVWSAYHRKVPRAS